MLLIIGTGISAGIALLVVVFMKFYPECLIWISLILVICTFFVLGFVFMYNGGGILGKSNQIGILGIPSTLSRTYYNIYGAFSFLAGGIIIIIFVCCCSDIHFAIFMTKTACKFIDEVPTVLILPVALSIQIGLFWATTVSSVIYALSSGHYIANGNVFSIVSDQGQRSIAFLYYFIANSIWTN